VHSHRRCDLMTNRENSPHYDAARQRVTPGYSIMQPRVSVSLPSTNRSVVPIKRALATLKP